MRCLVNFLGVEENRVRLCTLTFNKGIVRYSLKSDLIIEMQTNRHSETPREISSASV